MMPKVTLYTLRGGEDVEAGVLFLESGAVAGQPDTPLVRGLLASAVYDPEARRPVTAESDPGRWLSLLHRQYRGAYLRASRPREEEAAKSWDESKHPRGRPENAGRFADKPGVASALRLLARVAAAVPAALEGVAGAEHAVKEWAASGAEAAVARLPEKWRGPVKGCWFLLRCGAKAAFATYTAGQAAAEAVAKERGATPEQAAKLRAALSAVDALAGKPVVLAAELGGFPAAALAGFVPVGSLTYLAYSTARDPLATLRVARRAAKGALARLGVKKSDAAGVASLVYDALAAGGFSDETLALFLAALDASGDVRLAAEVVHATCGG